MKNNTIWIAILIWMQIQLPAIAAEKVKDRDGFYVPRAVVVERIKRVGMLPLLIPAKIGERDVETAHAEAELTKLLATSDFTVISSASFNKAYEEINIRIGGTYDTLTGVRDSNKTATLLEKALRTYIEAEKLDGFIQPVLLERTAQYLGYAITWDGVTDRTNGKPRPDNSFKTGWNESIDSQGSLSALSIAIDLRDSVGNPLYFGIGGYHTTAYMDPTGKSPESMFSYVPIEQWARDFTRMDRALAAATINLRLTREQRRPKSQGPAQQRHYSPPPPEPELPPSPEGVREKESVSFGIPREQILHEAKRVAVAPITFALLALSSETSTRYEKALAGELEKAGFETLDAQALSNEWRAAIEKTGGFYDRFTGQFNAAAEAAARKSVIEQFAKRTHFDIVLWPTIKLRSALYDGAIAKWDGTRQNTYFAGREKPWYLTNGEGPGGPKGSIDALSLEVVIQAKDGAQLYRALGGIHLIERLPTLPIGDFNMIPLQAEQWFVDADRDQQAAHLALRALTLTPEQLEAEINPPPKQEKSRTRR